MGRNIMEPSPLIRVYSIIIRGDGGREGSGSTCAITHKKIIRVEQVYQEVMLKTEFLKQQKQVIKKDIEFYKSAIAKLVHVPTIQAFIYDVPAD